MEENMIFVQLASYTVVSNVLISWKVLPGVSLSSCYVTNAQQHRQQH